MAAFSGLTGGEQGARELLHIPHPFSWIFGAGSYISNWSAFSNASVPDLSNNKITVILSTIASVFGALPSAALNRNEAAEFFEQVAHYSNSILNWSFGGASFLSNAVLGLDEGHQWIKNFTAFIKTLTSTEVNKTEKIIMVLCGLIVAYLAATSLIGYTPPVVALLQKMGASHAVAQCFGVLSNCAEWFFQTNMMFTFDKKMAVCGYFASPCPSDWRDNKTAAISSAILGLMSGLSFSAFTFQSMNKPWLGYLFAITAWIGGFSTSMIPAYKRFSLPTVNAILDMATFTCEGLSAHLPSCSWLSCFESSNEETTRLIE
tara:strand:+ start:1764 stop:2717 length:954 start_codon:yes stop_codon:yes gene_type:complete